MPDRPTKLRLSRRSTLHASTFKAHCLDVLDQVATRHVEVTVTKRGRPVAKLIPFTAHPPAAAFGALRDMVVRSDDLITPEAWPIEPDLLDD